MKELQQKEKELREMKQLGECFSLTYLGFYDNSFFWHSDIAPENPHKQAYWQYQGSDKRLISASRISLQQKENCSIRELESIESLNLLCSSIYNDLQYVGVGNAVTMEMIKEWPPVTNERKDALWKIEGRIFASSVTIMKEWSNLIKKLNTGMLAFKLVDVNEKLLSQMPDTVRCEYVLEQTLSTTYASIQPITNAIGKVVQGKSDAILRASEYIRQGLQTAGMLLYLGCGENVNAINLQILPTQNRCQKQAWWYDCWNGRIINVSLMYLVENGWVCSKALDLDIVHTLANRIHPHLEYLSGHQENDKTSVMCFRIREAPMYPSPIIYLTEEQLLLRAHCDDVAKAVSANSRKTCAFIGGVCKAEAQKLTFAENGRLEITVLLETLHVKGTIQSFFDPPEHHYDSKKGQWLMSSRKVHQKSLVDMNKAFVQLRVQHLVNKQKVNITVEDFQTLAKRNSLAYLGRPTSHKKVCPTAPSLEDWLLHKEEPIILGNVLADEFDNEYVPWTNDLGACLETEVWWQLIN